MKYKNILITGGAGFIGSNLAVGFKRRYPKLSVVCLDNLKRRGSELNLERLRAEGIDFIHADIRNPEDLLIEKEFDLMIECSAEPSVMAELKNPEYIINTNLFGTVNCLELAKRNKADIVFLSTSRVYPHDPLNRIKRVELESRFDWLDGQKIKGWSMDGFNADFTVEGEKTLYGATKLASEELVEEYIKKTGAKGVINRCGVVAGPWQFGKVDQGVFTYWMLAHFFKKGLKYIGFGGQGKQVRDLLHVDDLFSLIELQINNFNKVNKKVYMVGGGRSVSLSLLEATQICRRISGNRVKIGSIADNRPADIAIYLSDNSQVSKDLGWLPKKNAARILADTYNWIRQNQRLLKRIIQ